MLCYDVYISNCVFALPKLLNRNIHGCGLSLRYGNDFEERLEIVYPFKDRNRPCDRLKQEISCVKFDLSDMLYSGTHLRPSACRCLGNSGVRLHGTKDLLGILQDKGVMKASRLRHRQIESKEGFYHCEPEDYERALRYSRPQQIGEYFYRPVLIIDCRCYNSFKGKRAWRYTKSKCKRYEIVGLLLFPDGHKAIHDIKWS